MAAKPFLVVIWALLVCGYPLGALGSDLMLEVGAGEEECFFEDVGVNRTLYIDYSVVGTSQGDLDINFQLSSPQGRRLLTDYRKTDEKHEYLVTEEPGFYKLCFDNTFSTFSHKVVAFTVSAAMHKNGANWGEIDVKNLRPEEVYEMQVNDIKKVIERVRMSLNKIEGVQNQFKLVETKDRSTVENNFERVNLWSFLYLMTLLAIGTFQVLMVKSLFDQKYNVHHRLMKTFS